MDARRLARACCVAVLLTLAFVPSAAAVPPAADFSFAPPSPALNQQVNFAAAIDWGGTDPALGTIEWTFGDGSPAVTKPGSDISATHTYASTGTRTVSVKVTTADGVDVAARQLTVPNVAPVAAFSFGPGSPFTGQEVQFGSASFDPGGSLAGFAWDFGDGASSSVPNPRHVYSTPGPKLVTLTVTDADGAAAGVTQQVNVATLAFPNAVPHAGFAFSPRNPQAGDVVEFASSAVDPEGALREQRWDLDGDGQFDDAQGEQVLHTFSTAGAKTVRLRVEDAAGGAAVRERTVTVTRGQVARAGFLNPFPVVRITGEVRGGGTVVRILSVRAPRGSKVRLRCRGKTCPAKGASRVARRAPVRFKAFERLLRAGITLEIFVRKPGTIGKYTRFTIRAGASPKRVDRCLPPGSKRPVRCPS